MTLSSLVSGLIQTQNYHPTRLSEIKWIVNHTAQCPTQVGRGKFIMEFLQPASRRASAHIGLDQAEIWAGAQEEHTCWAAPGANASGLHIEHAGYAEYGSSAVWPDWTDPDIHRMVFVQSVSIHVDWCRRYDIPAVVCEPIDLLAGRKGITDHIRCTRAFGGSHWDCGPQFPIYEVVEEVKYQLKGGPSIPTPNPTESDDEMQIITGNDGNVWLVGGSTKSAVIGRNTWENTEYALNQMVLDGIASRWLKPTGGYNAEILACIATVAPTVV